MPFFRSSILTPSSSEGILGARKAILLYTSQQPDDSKLISGGDRHIDHLQSHLQALCVGMQPSPYCFQLVFILIEINLLASSLVEVLAPKRVATDDLVKLVNCELCVLELQIHTLPQVAAIVVRVAWRTISGRRHAFDFLAIRPRT